MFPSKLIILNPLGRSVSNFISIGTKVRRTAVSIAEKFNLNQDDKHTIWIDDVTTTITTMRKTYGYGLLFGAFNSFYSSKDKHILRDDVQKVHKLLREYGIPNTTLLPCIRDACASALKFKF